MNTIKLSVVFAALATVIAIGRECAAQATKVNTDEAMDGVFEIRKAAEAADKLAPEGARYCKWGRVSSDTSTLDAAISRFLLNHESRVPEEFRASKMWRVGFVAEDLANQLEMGLQLCNARLRSSDGARSLAAAAKPVLLKLLDATQKFEVIAYQQTVWQSRNNEKPENIQRAFGGTRVDTGEITTALREVGEAWDVARKVIADADAAKECYHDSSPTEPMELKELAKLLDYTTRAPRSANYTPAANVWLVAIEADTTELEISTTLESCTYFSGEKKKAERLASEALGAYHRLKAAITKVDLLALQQTEWEELMTQNQIVTHEQ